MVTKKCKHCGAVGFKTCTHGIISQKLRIVHDKKCPVLKNKRYNFNLKRRRR